jgi:hypothetical protein
MQIEMNESDFLVDAALLGELLRLDPSDVPALLKSRRITSFCERGVGEHAGQYRLTFFHGNRRARVSVDKAGRILRRSTIDFGDAALPRQLHRAGT